MNLVITADLLFYILVAPHVKEPKTSLDYAVLALTSSESFFCVSGAISKIYS